MNGRGAGWVVAQLALGGLYFALPWHAPRLSAAGIAGLFLAACGVLLFLAGLVSLGRSLTPLPVPKEGARLKTGGAYRLLRHPIYSGAVFALFGWALAARDWPRFGAACALFAFFDAKARFEEKKLAKRFPEYPAYARGVKRLIPWIY